MLDRFAISALALVATLILMRSKRVSGAAVALTTSLLRRISAHPVRSSVLAGVLWCAWLGYACVRDGRAIIPHAHDENAYLVQARIFAAGHLALPTPPAAEFFDTFHLLVRPTYAGKYPPGTSLVHAPALALGLPWLVTVLIVAGVGMAAFAFVAIRVAGPLGLPVCAVAALTCGAFQRCALELLSQSPLATAVALFWATAIGSRGRRGVPVCASLGFLGGLAVLIRPVDAVLLLIAPTIGVLVEARRTAGYARVAIVVGSILVGGLPAATFFGVVNARTTGSPWRPAWLAYGEQYEPGHRIGTADTDVRPLAPGTPQQKVDFYTQYHVPIIRAHHRIGPIAWWWSGERSPAVFLSQAFCGPTLLLSLLPLAAWGMWKTRQIAIAVSAALLLLLYSFYPFSGPNYFFPIVPLLWASAAAGIEATLRHRADSGARTRGGLILCSVLLVGLTQSSLPESIFARTSEGPFDEMVFLAREVDPKIHAPAIVFYRYKPGESAIHNEPVYNAAAADVFDNPIVRAHWLGAARSLELFEAFRARRRSAEVYLYDRATARLYDFGPLDAAIAQARANAGRAPATGAAAPAVGRPAS